MTEYELPDVIFSDLGVLDARLRVVSAKFVGLSYPPLLMVTNADLTAGELQSLKEAAKKLDILDTYDASKLRNLTITDINNRIATVQSQIDAVTNVATAKTALNSMYADMQKMARIILWLLKREMNGL
jgi:hypothetical protein